MTATENTGSTRPHKL